MVKVNKLYNQAKKTSQRLTQNANYGIGPIWIIINRVKPKKAILGGELGYGLYKKSDLNILEE